MIKRIMCDITWWVLIRAAHRWTSKYMDQWEKVKFETDYGPIFFRLSHMDEYPDSYDLVDRNGRPSGPPRGPL